MKKKLQRLGFSSFFSGKESIECLASCVKKLVELQSWLQPSENKTSCITIGFYSKVWNNKSFYSLLASGGAL